MADGRRRDAWYHTALVACLLAESGRDPKRRTQPFSETDFHPDGAKAYQQAQRNARSITASDREMLHRVFPSKQ
jgi:hypothetical protein